MASIDELIALIDADIARVEAQDSAVAATREHGNELAEQFAAMSSYGDSERTAEVADHLGEVQELSHAVKAKLEEARSSALALRETGSVAPMGSSAPVQQARATGWDSTPDLAKAKAGMTRLGEVTMNRRIHILDGDPVNENSGGHAFGTGRPGKSEFPESWDDDKIIDHTVDVANRPGEAPELQANGRWRCHGTREQVNMRVILDSDGSVRTSHPISGTGVHHNPR